MSNTMANYQQIIKDSYYKNLTSVDLQNLKQVLSLLSNRDEYIKGLKENPSHVEFYGKAINKINIQICHHLQIEIF